jgi:hypothetical protein
MTMHGVLPFFGLTHSAMSRLAPLRQLQNVGEASRLFSAAARLLRSFFLRNELTDSAPICAIGGLVRSCIKLPMSAFLTCGESPLGEHAQQHMLTALCWIGFSAK